MIEVWMKYIQLWTAFTYVPAEKMAIAVHLSLKGRASAASKVDVMESGDGSLFCV